MPRVSFCRSNVICLELWEKCWANNNERLRLTRMQTEISETHESYKVFSVVEVATTAKFAAHRGDRD